MRGRLRVLGTAALLAVGAVSTWVSVRSASISPVYFFRMFHCRSGTGDEKIAAYTKAIASVTAPDSHLAGAFYE